jgi:hypothetical protein
MTDEQAEKIIRELRAIKMALWTAILLAVGLWVTSKVIEAVIGPPPPPTVTVQPPR